MSKLVCLAWLAFRSSSHYCCDANICLFLLDIGANASAEEGAEELDDTKVKVNNIVASFRLQSTSFDKKGYLTYLKGTMKYTLNRFHGPYS